MDMASADVLYGISALCIVLGFIALLKQRLYIDERTQEPTAVELPLFGKLKTNYPALVFVFLGAGLAFYAIHESPPTEPWTLTGSLTNPSGKHVKWTDGTLTLIPQVHLREFMRTASLKYTCQLKRANPLRTFTAY